MNRLIKSNRRGGSTSFFLRTDLASKVILSVALLTFSLGQAAQARVQAFPIPTPDSQPISIILGPDGNLWFTEQNASNVARVTPDGVITEFRTPTFSFPLGYYGGPGRATCGSRKEWLERLDFITLSG